MLKATKFLQRSLNTFIASHGVRIGIGADSGARFLHDDDDDGFVEGRGKKKKKWSLILPLALMLKLVHMKLLLKPILLGVGLIQILLIAGGLFIFNYFRHSNICRIQPHLIHSHSHIASESAPGMIRICLIFKRMIDERFINFTELSYAAYGSYPSYSASPYNAYSKDWATNRAYSAYGFLDAIDSHKI